MGESILTIDLGNSRAKLALFRASREFGKREEFLGETRFETSRLLDGEIEAFLAAHPEIVAARLSSVAAPNVEECVSSVLKRRLAERFELNPPVAMAVDYLPEGALGRDRLYAARGAFEITRSAVLVVDAGTALTVDVVTGGNAGLFRGGAIAPGPRLLADALHRHTARLPQIEPRVGAEPRGCDTQAALQAGVVVGFRGAAAELALRIADDVQLSAGAPVVVTGGARDFLLRPTSCFGGRRVIEEPLLVHKGLLASMSDAQ